MIEVTFVADAFVVYVILLMKIKFMWLPAAVIEAIMQQRTLRTLETDRVRERGV